MTTAASPAAQAFDPFAGMAAMNSTTEEVKPDQDDDLPMVNDAAPPKVDEPKVDDEDDLVVGPQLDAAGIPAADTTVQANEGGADTAADAQLATPVSTPANEEPPFNPEAADGDAPFEPGQPMAGPGGSRFDPSAAAAAAAAGARHGGGGGGSPGLTGLIAGAASLFGKGAVKGFQLVANNVKADPSIPRRMTIGERLANRDPSKAQAFYDNAGDRVVSERIYRDAYNGMNHAVAEARDAERLFQEGVGEMRDILENSDVKALAQAANSSVGDYVHAVKSGTIADAAAKAVVQTLEQSSDFKAAEDKIVSAGTTFAEKKDAALAKMSTIETSFPDRTNTSLGKQQLADLAEGMKGDDVSKASAKVKKIMDEIESIANALKEAIRNALDKVASIFKPR